MKWLDRFVDKCIVKVEPRSNWKLRKEVKALPTLGKLMFLQYLDDQEKVRHKAELLRTVEDAEREQLKEIFRRNGYDEV